LKGTFVNLFLNFLTTTLVNINQLDAAVFLGVRFKKAVVELKYLRPKTKKFLRQTRIVQFIETPIPSDFIKVNF
jgi:hypothetical protein